MPRRRGANKKRILVTPKISDSTLGLTKDKSYEVLDKLGDMYFITNDKGKSIEASKNLFL